MRDAVIAGGGPAGSRAAALLAPDHDVLVLEDHPEPGAPVQCAGLVSDDVIKLSGVKPDILSTIHGAEVFFPNGSSVTVRSRAPKARTIDRHQLDSLMAEAAMDAGAEYAFGTKYLSHTVGGSVKVSASSGEIEARLLIGAEGHTSGIADSLRSNAPVEYLRGIQAEVAMRPEHDDLFKAHLGLEWAPGFFTWEIPCGDFVRAGLCSSWSAGPPMPYLKKLLKSMGAEDRVVSMQCGKIPLGPRPKMAGDRCMILGDAAAQVKPVSGGGLYPGLSAAGMLAEVAGDALESDDLSAKSLMRYQKMFDQRFGKELRRGYRLRKMLLRMDDADLDAAGRYASREDVRSVLDDLEIDRPSAVVGQMMRHPGAALAAFPLAMRCLL